MATALQLASSPHSWKQIVTPLIKPAFEVDYCFKWIKQLNINPNINLGLLVGDCLTDFFTIKECDDSAPVAEKKATQAGHSSVFDIVQPRENRSIKTKGRKTTTLQPEKKLNVHQREKNSAVHTQHKTISATYLQQWLDNASKDDINIPNKNDDLPLSRKKIFKQQIKGPNQKQSKLPIFLPLKKKHYQLKWQQQINHQVNRVLDRIKLKNITTKNKKEFSGQRNDPGTPAWKKQICPANETSKQISTGELNVIQQLERNQTQLDLTKTKEKMSFISNQFEHVMNNKKSKIFPTQKNSSKDQTPLEDIKNEALNISKVNHNHTNDNSQQAVTAQQAIRQLITNQENEKKEKSKVYFPPSEPSEFPPVKKHIIEELQSSGKRTALKSETNNEVNNQMNFDEDELAEVLKRIIDEQARRQGINV